MKKFREFCWNVLAYLGFIIFYILAYKDLLFQNSLFWAINLPPLPTSNSRFYIPGQLYWFPGNLGFPAQPRLRTWLSYVFVLISGGNLVLAEKLLASATLASCFTMYFFLSNHFGGSRLACFSASLIYGFGPATVLDFTDTTFWGYAMIPVVFNYMLNLFEENRRMQDVLLLGLSLSFMTAFLPQVLPLIFLSFLIFLGVRTSSVAQRSTYLRRVAGHLSLATVIFVATSPFLISGTIRLMSVMGLTSTSAFTPHPVSMHPYQSKYANQEIANIIRLTGGAPLNHLPTDNWIGFILPLFAFSSLLLVRRGKEMMNLLALTLISLVVVTIIYGIHLQAGWALWLLYNTPVRLFFYPERPLYVVMFVYSVMTALTLTKIKDLINNHHVNHRIKVFPSIIRCNLRQIFSILLALLLLTSVFLFAPVFDVQIHQERYHPLHPVYSSIRSWLSSRYEDGAYRVMFLPTDHFVDVLGYVDAFCTTGGYTLPHTQDYVDFVYYQLINDGSYHLGSLVAPASVKYIILTTVNRSTLWRSSMFTSPLWWWVSGPPRRINGGVGGDPAKIEILLNNQRDLRLIYSSDDFRVYENEMYMPKISVFRNAAYIIGAGSALSTLPYLPKFSVKKVLPIFAHQNPSLARDLPRICSSIVLFESDFNDYVGLLHASKYGINLIPFGTDQGWLRCDANATISTYTGSYVQTNVTQSLEVSFVVNASGTYDLWLEVLFSRRGGALSISVDNETIDTIATDNGSVAPGFHWIYIGSISLSRGEHFLTLLNKNGFNAVSSLAVIPSLDAQNIYEEAVNMIRDKKQVYLFIQDSSRFIRSVTTSPGQYYIAVNVPEPVMVNPNMAIIDLDSAQEFIITRENFKPSHNPPEWDFDNCNYYFYTSVGGNVSITLKGSGGLAYVAYNSTPSNIEEAHFIGVDLPDNGTFTVNLPPNTIFQPMVNAYNPDMGQNIPNNISEISIERQVGGKYVILSVDGVNITNTKISDAEGWSVFGPIHFDSGVHNLTVTNGIQGSLVAIYNRANLAEIFGGNTNVNYEFSKFSETAYNVRINTDGHIFLSLSESYHPNWFAYSESRRLMHFIAFSYSNGFYLNRTGVGDVYVKVEYEPPLLNHVYVVQQILFAATGLFIITSPIIRRIGDKIRNRGGDYGD